MNTFSTTVLFSSLLIFSSCSTKPSSSEPTEETLEGYSSESVESMADVYFTSQVTTKLDYNNRPTDDVSYMRGTEEKVFVHLNFNSIPNGKHKYQSQISTSEQQGIYLNSIYDFEVTNGRHQVWSWFSLSALQGAGDYTIDLYMDGIMIAQKPLKILSEEQANSGDFVPYWLNESLFGLFTSNEYSRREDWRIQQTKNLGFNAVSSIAFPFEGFNRYFVVVKLSNQKYALQELRTDENITIREFETSIEDLVKFHFQIRDRKLLLYNYHNAFNTTVDLLTNKWTNLEETVSIPEKGVFPSPNGSYTVNVDCEKGLILSSGSNQTRIRKIDCQKGSNWVTWNDDSDTFYFDTETGVYAYQLNGDMLKQILYNPSASNPTFFKNEGLELLAYTSNSENNFNIATQFNTNQWLMPETDPTGYFKRILNRYEPELRTIDFDFSSDPIELLNEEYEFEMEYVTTLIQEMGSITSGNYTNGTLMRFSIHYEYDDKGATDLYTSTNWNYCIMRNDSLFFLRNHIPNKNLVKNLNLQLPSHGFEFTKFKPFQDAKAYLLDPFSVIDGLKIEENIELDSIKFKLLASIPEYHPDNLEKLDDTNYFKLKEDDGSINKLLNDGSRHVYEYDFSGLEVSNSNIDPENYVFYTTRGCWGGALDIASIHMLNESELEQIGQLGTLPILTFRNINHSSFQETYDTYRTALDDSGVLEHDESATFLSFDSYMDLQPIFFIKDPFGRYVRFIHKNLLPPANCEPIVYFYPEKEQEINFSLDKKIDVLASYPKYNDGWKIMVNPDGQLIDAKTGARDHRIFWEGLSGMLPKLEKGHVVEKAKIDEFLTQRLADLGLNELEILEFKEAWLTILMEKDFCFIGFYPQSQIENYAPIHLDPEPETLIRVLMDYEPLDYFKEVETQGKSKTPKRTGFTVVEWGGLKR